MGTTAEKLKYLNETKAEIKNALETPYNVMRDYPELIKKYIDNQPTKVVTDGICGNAVDVPVKAIEINGNIRQETTQGKNLFDNTVEPQFISNAKKEIINTGERIILTAKTFSYAIFKVEKNIREYAGKTVRLKMDFSKSNANLNPKYGVLLGSSDYSNRELKGESTVSGYTITFNLPSELENEKEYLFVRLYATQNNEGNIENYVDYTNVIITIDNEDMTYEPYTGGTPSPNPEYPQEIETINSIGFEQSGKNKFDNFKAYSYSNSNLNTTSLSNGIKIEKKSGFGLWVFDNLENLDEKIVRAKSKFNDGGSIAIGLASLNGTSRTIMKENTKSDTVSSFVIPKITDDKKYLAVWLYGSDNSEISYEDLIVTIDNEDMTYEPYHEPKVISINLNGNTLAKVGEIKDILKVNRNGEVEIKKNIEKIVLTGSEKLVEKSSSTTRTYWGIDFSNYGIYQYDDSTKTCDILTTKFKSRPQQGSFLPGQVALITGKKNVYFIFEPDTTEEQARAILTDMPVYFRLAEPQTIKLSSISPIELWQGTNIFKLITNLDTDFEVEYVVDKDSVTKEEE